MTFEAHAVIDGRETSYCWALLFATTGHGRTALRELFYAAVWGGEAGATRTIDLGAGPSSVRIYFTNTTDKETA